MTSNDPTDKSQWLQTLHRERSKTDKSWAIALCLSMYLGILGADRFYLNQLWLGLIKLLTLGGFTIWWLADIVLLLMGKMRDAEGRIVRPPYL